MLNDLAVVRFKTKNGFVALILKLNLARIFKMKK